MLIHCELYFLQWLILLLLTEAYFDSFGVIARDVLLVIDCYCRHSDILLFWFGTPSKFICIFPRFQMMIS